MPLAMLESVRASGLPSGPNAFSDTLVRTEPEGENETRQDREGKGTLEREPTFIMLLFSSFLLYINAVLLFGQHIPGHMLVTLIFG
jgi:hypothetical protein